MRIEKGAGVAKKGAKSGRGRGGLVINVKWVMHNEQLSFEKPHPE